MTRSDNEPPLPRRPRLPLGGSQPKPRPPVLGEALTFCPRPRAARFGAASGVEGHDRAQAAQQPSTDRPYRAAPRGSSHYSADEERVARRDLADGTTRQ